MAEDGKGAEEVAKEAAVEDGEAQGAAEGDAMDVDERAKEPEEPKEMEVDAPVDSRRKVSAGTFAVSPVDTTVNVMVTCGGKILMALTDSGFQHFVAAARASAGIKSGRYIYEVRLVETRNPTEVQGNKAGSKSPRQLCVFGFAAAGASHFIGDGAGSVGFDSEGSFCSGNARTKLYQKLELRSHQVYSVLLNLDADSPNANTVSLFQDGVRVCQPQPIPQALRGKALFPTVNYKNVTLHLNFGPEMFASLPFRCRMVQDAAADDVEVAAAQRPANSPAEVLFPIGLPDEGTFDWLDVFLKENPRYFELSQRAILDWGLKSGLWRQKGVWRSCNDRPSLDFGVRDVDEGNLTQLLKTVVPVLERDFVVMEVQKNLLEEERRKVLAEFADTGLRKVALVVMGEPPASHKANVQEIMLGDKKKRAASDVLAKKAAEKHKETRAKQAAAKAAAAERKDDAQQAEDGDKEDGEKGADETAPTESKAKELQGKDDESLQELIKKAQESTVLTDEEKQVWFRKQAVPDLSPKELAHSFPHFTLPKKGEGFDEIRYVWQSEEACEAYLASWMKQRKLTQRVEDLTPGTWFREQWGEWTRTLNEWRRRHTEWKEKERNNNNSNKNDEWDQKKSDWEKKKDDWEQKNDGWDQKTDDWDQNNEGWGKKDSSWNEEKGEAEVDGTGKEDSVQAEAAETKEGEEAKGAEENAEKEKEEEKEETNAKMDVCAEDIDPFSVQDVCDIGSGQPLFADFEWEDWMLLSLRFELHLLVHAYKHDMNDPQRPSFHEKHTAFYYNLYYKKALTLKYFGVESVTDLLALIKDTIEVPKDAILDPQLADDTPLENFMKLTEDGRRERQRALDAGDEGVELKFQRPPRPPPQAGGRQQGMGYPSRAPPGRMQHVRGQQAGREGSRGGGGYGGGSSSRYGTQPPPPPPGRHGGPPPAARYDGGRNAPPRGASSYGGGNRSTYGGGPQSGRYPPGPPPAPPSSRGGGGGYGGSDRGGQGQKRGFPQSGSGGGGGGGYPQKQARGSYGDGGPSRGDGGRHGGGGGYRR